MMRIFGRVVLMAMAGVLLVVGVATAQQGIVELEVGRLPEPAPMPPYPPGMTLFSYQLTALTENVTSWEYHGSNIIDADVDGDAQMQFWTVVVITPTMVVFFAEGPPAPLGFPLTGFHIVGLDVDPPGQWVCHDLEGFVDGPLPVELSSFTASAGDATITLRWTTASELNNLGFHVYRGLQKEGPYERITAERIEGAGSSTMPRTYTFSDVRLKNGLVYYYKLEDVSLAGVKEMHGPIAAKPVSERLASPIVSAPPVVRSSWGAVKMLLK